ncbi:MAG: three-Cys-motif partner protein TcmP [Opitutaceae bacterium]|jgi:three-Cys-motif partner protein
MKFIPLPSAEDKAWSDSFSKIDGLPLRDSGSWIEEKHRVLVYFADIFATSMKPTARKRGWKHRIYLELFSGPGRCLVRDTGKEEPGSPLKVIDHEFTRFIFIDISTKAARALEQRLTAFPNADKVEIWNGDCAEAIQHIEIPSDALTLAFIDPTGIAHAPFQLIHTLRTKTRCDLLINVQHGMGIKMNMHQYTPDADADCALTRFLGDESWKKLLGPSPREFFLAYLQLYRKKLRQEGFAFSENQVMVNMRHSTPLYLLLFASRHPLGQKFWDKAVQGSNPQMGFGF